MQHIISAEQSHVIALLKKGSDDHADQQQTKIKVKYLDSKVAADTLLMQCTQDLAAGKQVQILCPDATVLQVLIEAMEHMDIADYTILADEHEAIHDKKISKLRANLKSKEQKTSSDAARYRYQFAKQDLQLQYQNLSNPIQGDITIRDLPLVIQQKRSGQTGRQELVNIDSIAKYGQELSYHQLLGTVHELSGQYNSIFAMLAQSELLSGSAANKMSDLETIEKQADLLRGLFSEAKQVHQRYTALSTDFEQRYLQNQTAAQQQSVQQLRSLLINLASGQEQQETSKSMLSFFKKNNKSADTQDLVVKQVEEIMTVSTISYPAYDGSADRASLAMWIETVLTTAEKATSTSEGYSSVVKHLSQLNQQDPIWDELSTALSDLTTRVNTSELLAKQFENNSKGLRQQASIAAEICDVLHQAIFRLEHHQDYYRYRANISADPLKQQIISEFKHLPTATWKETFDRCYFEQKKDLSLKNTLPDSSKSEPLQLLALAESSNKEALTNLQQLLANQQSNSVEALKVSNKPLFQSLTKKKLPMSSTAAELTGTFFEESKQIFPLQIRTRTANQTGYDCTYAIGAKTQDLNMASVCFAPFEEADFENMSETKDYLPLYLNHYQYKSTIEDLSNTDKIKAAKKLAKLLLSCSQDVKLYQLREANIISLLPYQDDQLMEAQLLNKGAKTTHLDDLYLQLVESILETGRSQYLIVKDGLIRAEDHDQLLFQLDVLQKFASAGIRVLSVYTKDQLMAGIEDPITQLVDQILPTAKKEKGIPNIETSEIS